MSRLLAMALPAGIFVGLTVLSRYRVRRLATHLSCDSEGIQISASPNLLHRLFYYRCSSFPASTAQSFLRSTPLLGKTGSSVGVAALGRR